MTGLAPEVSVLPIALGLALALVCHLTTNLSPGGMITPGWLALVLIVEPALALGIAAVVLPTYALGRALQAGISLYGKRLFATVVLIGVLLQMTVALSWLKDSPVFFDYTTIGFIVPGLVAYQLLRQPRMATIAATATVTTATYSVMLTVILLGLFPTEPDAEIADTWASISSTELALSAAGAAVVLALAGIQARRLRRSSMPASILERS